jgi:uncharacterized membrane protein
VRRARYATFAAWTAVGAGACLALLTLLTIGVAVLVVVLIAGALLVRRAGTMEHGVTGLMSGAGLLALFIAYLNRHGPGEYCQTTATEQHCSTEWSPWPWLVVGVVLVAGGVLLFREALRDRDRGQGPDAGLGSSLG